MQENGTGAAADVPSHNNHASYQLQVPGAQLEPLQSQLKVPV